MKRTQRELTKAARFEKAVAQGDWRSLTGAQIENVLSMAEEIHSRMQCARDRRRAKP